MPKIQMVLAYHVQLSLSHLSRAEQEKLGAEEDRLVFDDLEDALGQLRKWAPLCLKNQDVVIFFGAELMTPEEWAALRRSPSCHGSSAYS